MQAPSYDKTKRESGVARRHGIRRDSYQTPDRHGETGGVAECAFVNKLNSRLDRVSHGSVEWGKETER